MTTKHKFKPYWRRGTQTIEVVSSPDAAWFASLSDYGKERRGVRFALMENGNLFFGDAFLVVHRDIMQIVDNGIAPIFVGVLLKHEGVWRLSNVQWWGRSDDGSFLARGLLPTLTTWIAAVAALGQDPLAFPNWGME